MRRTLGHLFAGVLLLAGCETDECKELKKELDARKSLLRTAQAQAGVLEPTKKRASAAEGNALKLLRALGVDQPESKIQAELFTRVAKIPTATITREAVLISVGGPEEQDPSESVTQWVIRFDAKDVKTAFDHTAALLQNPPLVRFASLIREDPKKNRWRVELRRATVVQIPINPQIQPMKTGRNLDEIPSKFGFCGAGSTREEIKKIDAEMEQLRANAEAVTVELPKAASYEGLRRRAEMMRDEESETRDHLAIFEEALTKSGAKLKAVGTEEALSVLEIWGASADRTKVEKALLERGMGDLIQPRKEGAKGVERIMVKNRAAERRLRPIEAGPQKPNQPHQHKPEGTP
jgi:hypothetical protein